MEETLKIVAKYGTLDKETLLKDLERVIADADYDLSKARSPKSKRHKKAGLTFFSSIYKHLKGL